MPIRHLSPPTGRTGSAEALTSLTYVSSAVRLLTQAELKALLRVSVRNNAAREITGMLLYDDGNFMQVLEGPEKAVDEVHRMIAADPRHRGMLTLLRKRIPERQFARWSMAFQNVDELSPEERAGFSTFLRPLTAESYESRPHDAWQLLLSFRGHLR